MTTTTPAGSAPSVPARAGVLTAAMLTIMAAAVIAPSLPAMSTEFAGREVLVRLTLTVTSLAIAVTAPIAGILADRLGRRPILVTSLALFAVAGTAGYFLPGLGTVIASRALLGVAVGGIMTSIGAIITDWFGGPRRATFLGLQQAFASIGGVVFLPLAGALAGVSWRTPFLIYAVALLVLPLALAIREPARTTAQAAAADARTAPGAVRWIAGTYALVLVATVVFFMAPTQLPFHLPAFGAGTTVTGMVVAGSTVTGILGALAFPRLRSRLSAGAITALAVALLGAGWLLVGTAAGLAALVAGILVGGTGVGIVVPNLNLRLAEVAPPARRGRILSGLVVAIFGGQFLSPLAVQPLTAALGIGGAFAWTGAGLLVLSALMAFTTIRRP
ncbi:MFS transporter [Couchioplanes azureus]|uniref:MFS transporter n=1 Tax=Couchioplanes caeruleus TaxID=56438 RepID=UPI001670E557|nr:MFS transporter [Couchioplanes caeruleus]GGQ82625.1 MFS transporter [Couchioplanes caeruleus subsp. azureus]